MDTESYPWAPDIWQISCLLASARGQQDKGQVPDLKLAGPALASLLPHSTAFTLLTEPLMAQGLALKLKRECAVEILMSITIWVWYGCRHGA